MSRSESTDIHLKLEEHKPTNSPSLHLLPFQVGFSSNAKVSNFFKTEDTTQKANLHEKDPFDVKEASFRGRLLKGVKIPVPSGYQGLILRDGRDRVLEYTDNDDEAVSDEKDQKNWTISGSFSSLSYWTREVSPTQTDKLFKWLPWVHLATILHTNEGVAKDESTNNEKSQSSSTIEKTSNDNNNNNNNSNNTDNNNNNNSVKITVNSEPQTTETKDQELRLDLETKTDVPSKTTHENTNTNTDTTNQDNNNNNSDENNNNDNDNNNNNNDSPSDKNSESGESVSIEIVLEVETEQTLQKNETEKATKTRKLNESENSNGDNDADEEEDHSSKSNKAGKKRKI